MSGTNFGVQSENVACLPSGWEVVRLVEVANIVMGQSPPSSTYNQNGIGLPFFQGKAEFGELYPTPRVYCSEPKKIAQEGAVLLSVRAPVGPVNLAPSLCSIGRGLSAIHPLDGIPSKFVLYFFRSFANKLAKQATGTTFKSISKKTVEDIPIVIPPLNEQRRIVAKIEELFSELDAGVAALEQARAQLKRYRQALLKAAFEGRLTEQWRQARADELEPAEVLLARIRAEREARWRAQLAEWEEAVRAWEAAGKPGKKPRKPRKPKDLPPLTEEERTALPELPEGWAWVRAEELCPYGRKIAYGVLQPGPHVEDGVRLVRVGDIDDGKIDMENLKKISPEIAFRYRKTMLEGGELLITLVGAIGRTAIVPTTLRGANVARAVAVVPLTEHIEERYVELYLRSATKQQEMISKAHEVARKTLNLEDVKNIAISLAPRDEQSAIVKQLETYLVTADNLAQTIEQALAQAAALRQAILKKAFSGRLAPQDPEDEPANVLLERIRGEGPRG